MLINKKIIINTLELTIPADLYQALMAKPRVIAKWKTLTLIAQFDFVVWIQRAKKPATRLARIHQLIDMLMAGKRRVCCFSIMPLDLQKALAKNASIKLIWEGLDSIERRRLILWIDEAKDATERVLRIQKMCTFIAIHDPVQIVKTNID